MTLTASDTCAPGQDLSPQPRTRILVGRLLAALLLAVVLGAAAFRSTGGRWLMVTSSSMGAAAPVGTLLLTRPISAGQVRVGDIIAFHPPSGPGRSFSHRVIGIGPDGGLQTKGDLNGATDPWTLHDSDLTGRVVLRGWGLGWLLRALPLLIVGMGTVWLATRRRPPHRWHLPARLLGGSLLFAVAGVLLKPFVAMSVITTASTGGGTALSIVSTGLLPVRVRASGGDHVDLMSGHLGAITARSPHPGAAYQLSVGPHMPLLWWLAVGLICVIPLGLGLILTPGPTTDELPSQPADPRRLASTS